MHSGGNILVHILPFIEEQAALRRHRLRRRLRSCGEDRHRAATDQRRIDRLEANRRLCLPQRRASRSIDGSRDEQGGIYPEETATFKMANYAASRGSTQQFSTSTAIVLKTIGTTFRKPRIQISTFLLVSRPRCRANIMNAWWKYFSGPFTRYPGVRQAAARSPTARRKRSSSAKHAPSATITRKKAGSPTITDKGSVSTIVPINFDTCRKKDQTTDFCQADCNWLTSLGFRSPHPGGAHLRVWRRLDPFSSTRTSTTKPTSISAARPTDRSLRLGF